MVVLVQVAFKKIEKYDKNNNLICVYQSQQECMKKENISSFIIRKSNKEDKLHNGYYYKIIDNPSYYVTAICDNCNKPFQCERFRIEQREHLFCSKKCEGEFRKSQTELNCVCEVCGKQYHIKQSHIDKYGSKYCSKKCQDKARKSYMKGEGNHQFGLKGNKNASWKSDEKISSYGYKLIRCLNHPFANIDGFVFEHRLVAERYLLNEENSVIVGNQKYLSADYVVHHIDFDRLNNDKNNLIVLTLNEHTKLHKILRNNLDQLLNYCLKYNLDYEIIKQRLY